jgi:glucosamine-6-phosphate deaminase
VGPVGQYPFFIQAINQSKTSLKNCWFFSMDEYLDGHGDWIDENNRLSFRGYMNREVYSKIDSALVMPEAQRVFPDPHDPAEYTKRLSGLGGADLCIGGIGINGHLAFNEPQPELAEEAFMALRTRVLRISPETLTANAIDAMGGDIEDMPQQCVTAGMNEILSARKIRIGVFRVWHRAVVRRAAYGETSTAFPASLLQRHADAVIAANETAAEKP